MENANIYPFMSICKMYVYLDCGCSQSGTGFLVSGNRIITAAHNLVCNNRGSDGALLHSNGQVPYINIYFGFCHKNNNLSYINKLSNVTDDNDTDFYYLHYLNSRKPEYDYGYIKLDATQASQISNLKQYFSLVSLSDTALDNKSVIIAGYPEGTTLYSSEKNIKNTTSTRVYYDVDTSSGQSGSPIFYCDNVTYKVVGIHTNGFNNASTYQLNYGRRLTDTLITELTR